MKLISLNIWGGQVHSPLLDFIASHRDIDVFCLQEVYHEAKERVSDDDSPVRLNIFSEMHALLPDHQGFFRPVVGDYGIATFVKKGIDVLDEGEIWIHDNPHYPGRGPSHSRNLQWITCRINDEPCTVINVHGLWNGKGKTDCPERIAQSQKIRQFIDPIDSRKILCGDFNLRPDTESLKMLGEGMQNLIQKHNITSTRTSLYPKAEKFADYIFTSPEITVNTFEVMPVEVSDHSPLLLDFN